MQKLYCYVDENGSETEGRVFIVAVVVVGDDPLPVVTLCEEFERDRDKGKFKWRKAEQTKRLDYSAARIQVARSTRTLVSGHLSGD